MIMQSPGKFCLWLYEAYYESNQSTDVLLIPISKNKFLLDNQPLVLVAHYQTVLISYIMKNTGDLYRKFKYKMVKYKSSNRS